MSGDLLFQLQQAASDEEREYIVLQFSLNGLSNESREAVLAAAVPHWFDSKFLAILMNRPKTETASILTQIATHSFIQEVPGKGYVVHERSRSLLLGALWRHQLDLYKELSSRAAGYCSQMAKESALWSAEAVYHRLIAEPEIGLAEFQSLASSWYGGSATERIEAMLMFLREHLAAGRLSKRAKAWVLLWEALLETKKARLEIAASKLDEIDSEELDDLKLDLEVKSVRRYIEWLRRSPEQLFLTHLPALDRMIRYLGHSDNLRPDEIDDLASFVKLKLIEDNFALIRAHKGNSSFSTFLSVLIRRLTSRYLDNRRRRWRPSFDAMRMGKVAVKLDQLLYRDGYTLDEAYQILRNNEKFTVSRDEVRDLASMLPSRTTREEIGTEALAQVEAESMRPDQRLLERESKLARERVDKALRVSLGELTPEEQMMVKMRFVDDQRTGEIARTLGLDPKVAYRRMEKVTNRLRSSMLRQGIDESEIRYLLASGAFSQDEEGSLPGWSRPFSASH